MTGMSDNDWKPNLILKIFSLKKCPNMFVRSTRFVWLSNITSENLCMIFLKLFHNDFSFPSFSVMIFEKLTAHGLFKEEMVMINSSTISTSISGLVLTRHALSHFLLKRLVARMSTLLIQ